MKILRIFSYMVVVIPLVSAAVYVLQFKEPFKVHRWPTRMEDPPDAMERTVLFDKFQLSNLEMLRKLENPRDKFTLSMYPTGIDVKTPYFLKEKEIKWNMIVAIKSDYKRISQRNAIRRSWGSIRLLNAVRIEVLFVMAKPNEEDLEATTKRENEEFRDLLQVEMNEAYRGIGMEALAAMQWVGENFPDNWIYFSGDDDIFPDLQTLLVNIQALIEHAKNVTRFENSLPIHCAIAYKPNSRVHRDRTKWSVTKKQYPHPFFPPICLEGFYGLTVKLAKSIYDVSRHFPYFHVDDVFVTGFMRLKVCDTFRKNEYNFDQSDGNCAISTAPSSNFRHISMKSEAYIKRWQVIEKKLITNGARIIKPPAEKHENITHSYL